MLAGAVLARYGLSAAGGVAAVIVLLREGGGARRKAIPYGPFLAFGAIAVMLLQAP